MMEVSYEDITGPPELFVTAQRLPSCEWSPETLVTVRHVETDSRMKSSAGELRAPVKLLPGATEVHVFQAESACHFYADINENERVSVAVWAPRGSDDERAVFGTARTRSAHKRAAQKAVLKCRGF